MGSLSTLVPSSAATEAAGRKLATVLDPAMRHQGHWENVSPYVRHHYTSEALGILNRSGPHLVADVLEHLVANHKEFGFSAHTVDQLIDATLLAKSDLPPVGIPGAS